MLNERNRASRSRSNARAFHIHEIKLNVELKDTQKYFQSHLLILTRQILRSLSFSVSIPPTVSFSFDGMNSLLTN